MSTLPGKDHHLSAFEQIFRRWYPILCTYSRIFVKEKDQIENLVQDLMMWIWENRTRLSISTSLSSYLITAIRNRCLKYLDREKVRLRAMDDMGSVLDEYLESADSYTVKELESKVMSAVMQLPEDWRTVFVMNRFGEKTYEEIADQLGISPKTVGYRICRSLKMLRECLKDYLVYSCGAKNGKG